MSKESCLWLNQIIKQIYRKIEDPMENVKPFDKRFCKIFYSILNAKPLDMDIRFTSFFYTQFENSNDVIPIVINMNRSRLLIF